MVNIPFVTKKLNFSRGYCTIARDSLCFIETPLKLVRNFKVMQLLLLLLYESEKNEAFACASSQPPYGATLHVQPEVILLICHFANQVAHGFRASNHRSSVHATCTPNFIQYFHTKETSPVINQGWEWDPNPDMLPAFWKNSCYQLLKFILSY